MRTPQAFGHELQSPTGQPIFANKAGRHLPPAQ